MVVVVVVETRDIEAYHADLLAAQPHNLLPVFSHCLPHDVSGCHANVCACVVVVVLLLLLFSFDGALGTRGGRNNKNKV